MKDILVIIPQFNNLDLLKSCINSLEAQVYARYDILVVDNNSTDGTRDYLNSIDVEKILLDDNIGFAGAVNKGLEYAQDKNYPYAILLNNDTEVDTDFIQELKNKISSDDKIFSASSFMISMKDKSIVDDAGDSYTILGFAFQNSTGQRIDNYIKRENIFSSCAGAAIYNMKILKEVGFFDKMHFAYLEDIDLGYRAKINGYKNVFAENAICYHVGSATSGSKYNKFKVRLSSRNNIYIIYKNMPLLQILINLPFLILGTLVKQVFFIKKGFGGDFFFGIIDGIKDLPKLNKVKFRFGNIINYVKIEIELIINTFFYFIDYIKRHV